MSAASDYVPATRPLRVMLVDDHETVREGLRALFRSVPNVDIVHESHDGEAAMVALRTVAPDILVVDLSMPRAGGLTVMRRLLSARRQTKVIVLTRYCETGYVREAFAAGASGYVLKQSAFAELQLAIATVQRGGRYLDAALIAAPAAPAIYESAARATDRELDVLRRSSSGDSNKMIAEALEITVKTVEAHKAAAMRKLGLINRRQVIRYAALHGWFDDV